MEDQIIAETDQKRTTSNDATRKHIRGSTLLLIGRLIMLGINFGTQVLTVRYLAKTEFGAFSYGLSLVAMAAVIALFGLDKAVARFVPIYHEQRDYPRMFGTILLTLFSILSLGIVVVLVVFVFQSVLGQILSADPLSISLLLVLITLTPMQALESYFQDMLAVFAKPRAIFFRRYVIGPILKLLAVLLVLILDGNAYHLAAGYVVGGLIGLALNGGILWSVLRSQGLLAHFHWKGLIFPVKDIFQFSIPLLSSDFLNMLKGSAVVLLLEYYRTTVDVAEYRAVVPVAGLNLVVMQSFKMLYTPMAARLFAHQDRQGINNLYWRTATWIALFSFPVFVVTFSLAEPLTILLFGERYAQSGVLLALLSFGNYFNAALGFNSYTLRVYGRVKYIVLIDVLSAVANLGINFALIPQFGALGAAVGTCVTLVIYNLLNHAGLLLGTGINLFERRYMLVYGSILIAACGLLAFEAFFQANIFISLVFAGLVSLALLRINRATLDVENMFPEILRIPLMRPILGV